MSMAIMLGLAAVVAAGSRPDPKAMSAAYWEKWNGEEQARIDADIEKNRKADFVFRDSHLPPGVEVQVEQLTHDFIFGAHIFNYNQLGNAEQDARYQALYGTIFNSATIAFYWQPFEPVEGHPRFQSTPSDTPEFWRTCKEPKAQPHWRRPPTDEVVDFCQRKGIRAHGHVLAWGNYCWHMPSWLTAKATNEMPFLANAKLDSYNGNCLQFDKCAGYEAWPLEDIPRKAPEFVKALNGALVSRVSSIALRYGKRIQSWDVVNESAIDYAQERLVPGAAFCKSLYGPMPGDYAFRTFKLAECFFPDEVLLNINDYVGDSRYLTQVTNLLARGCKVQVMGSQMHLFLPQQVRDIANGSDLQSPASVRAKMELLGQAGLPIHISEITITAPNNDALGQAQQAIVARNLYRLWFSLKPIMGITWWNVVDGCGAPGEPAVSGLFSRQMEPKPAFHELERLILKEWRTNLRVMSDKDGKVCFRGFRGRYRLSWLSGEGRRWVEVQVR